MGHELWLVLVVDPTGQAVDPYPSPVDAGAGGDEALDVDLVQAGDAEMGQRCYQAPGA
ncbi:MAG TPA: hypothetical protein PLY96_00630 [Chromatiaceae bacterium]|nr:hypothetical protein [Chromatiaceae bacterium]HQP31433.1 hypothetical protein [Deltaproteobacteria bacterium]